MIESQSGGALLALSQDIAGTVDRVASRVVAVEGRDRVGSSGWFVRPGVIVTADHALENLHPRKIRRRHKNRSRNDRRPPRPRDVVIAYNVIGRIFNVVRMLSRRG
jgi:hypothetical protein